MTPLLKKIVVICFIFTILPYSIKPLSSKVSAQETQTINDLIRVSPFILNLDLKANTIETHVITIENLTDIPLPIRINPGFFDAYDETGAYIFPEKEPERSLARWLSIDNRELVLDPRSKETVTLTITTPTKLENGGYYGMLFIEPIVAPGTTGSILQAKIGVLLLANIGNPTLIPPPVQFERTELPWICADLNGIEQNLTIRNRSIYHISTKPFLTFKPIWGQQQQTTLEDKVLFPGRSRIWEDIQITCPTIPGFYTLNLSASYGEGEQIFMNKKLMVLPYQYLLGFLVITAILSGIFLRKRLMKAARILFARPKE